MFLVLSLKIAMQILWSWDDFAKVQTSLRKKKRILNLPTSMFIIFQNYLGLLIDSKINP